MTAARRFVAVPGGPSPGWRTFTAAVARRCTPRIVVASLLAVALLNEIREIGDGFNAPGPHDPGPPEFWLSQPS